MADDWQVGDLALCIANRLPPPYAPTPSNLIRVGAIYTVTSVRWSHGHQCTAIGLAEVRSRGPVGDWRAIVFRKIQPLTDEERRSFVAELDCPVLQPNQEVAQAVLTDGQP